MEPVGKPKAPVDAAVVAWGPVALVVSPHARRMARQRGVALAGDATSAPAAGQGAPDAPVATVPHDPSSRHDPTEADAALRLTRETLSAVGVTVAAQVVVSDLRDERALVAEWRGLGCVAVIAAGGDGTVGAAATCAALAGLPLGILPLGTSNDIARSLNIPMDIMAAATLIANRQVTLVDAGQAFALRERSAKPGARWRAFFQRRSPEPTLTDPLLAEPERLDMMEAAPGVSFLHALTLGLNVEFARLATDETRRAQWGALTYAASAIEALTHARPIRLRLRVDGYQGYPTTNQANLAAHTTHEGSAAAAPGRRHAFDCHVLQIAVVNLPVFGGAFGWRAPGTLGDDRLLDFFLVEAMDQGSLRATVEGLMAGLERLTSRLRGVAQTAGVTTGAQMDALDALNATAIDETLGFALPGMRRFRARAATISAPDEPTPLDITLDGELRAQTPILVRVAPTRLPVFTAGGPLGSAGA